MCCSILACTCVIGGYMCLKMQDKGYQRDLAGFYLTGSSAEVGGVEAVLTFDW